MDIENLGKIYYVILNINFLPSASKGSLLCGIVEYNNKTIHVNGNGYDGATVGQ